MYEFILPVSFKKLIMTGYWQLRSNNNKDEKVNNLISADSIFNNHCYFQYQPVIIRVPLQPSAAQPVSPVRSTGYGRLEERLILREAY